VLNNPLETDVVENNVHASTPSDEYNQLGQQNSFIDEIWRQYNIQNDTMLENRVIRKRLLIGLTTIALIWLIFTGVIIGELAFGTVSGRFSDAIAIAFITTSLATVMGLWHFGLQYFFTPNT